MPARTVLITGASRGLGAEFVKQYVGAGWHVIAACRSGQLPAEYSGSSSVVEALKLDVTSSNDISAAAAALSDRSIDLLINNAGVALDRKANLAEVNYDAWTESLNTNVLGTHRVTAALLPALARSGPSFKIVCVTSRLGSIANTLAPLAYDLQSTDVSYRSSKAALNMSAACIAVELRKLHPEALICVLDPGWVNTDMGSKGGIVKPPLEPPEVIAGMMGVIETLTVSEHNGAFLNWKGEPTPW